MRKVLPVSLPESLFKEVKKLSQKQETSISEIVREALKQFLFKTEFEEIRRKAMIEAEKKENFYRKKRYLRKYPDEDFFDTNVFISFRLLVPSTPGVV